MVVTPGLGAITDDWSLGLRPKACIMRYNKGGFQGATSCSGDIGLAS